MPERTAIVNRRAGGAALRDSLLDRVRSFAPRIRFTEYAGHATLLAREAAASSRDILVAGGDGTLLEVLNGLDPRRHTIALLPTGRGNSLARDLGLYPLARALDALTRGRTVAIDLMEVTFRDAAGQPRRSFAASTVATGYPAAVARYASNGFARFGRYSYAAAAAILRPAPAALTIGGRRAVGLTAFVANNTRHMANFVALPDADCRDGAFEILELRAGYLGQLAHNLSALSRLNFYRPAPPRLATAVAVALDGPQLLMLDGELHPAVAAFEVRLLPGALSIRVCA